MTHSEAFRLGNMPHIEEGLVLPERSFAACYDVPQGESRAIYERVRDDVVREFDELRLSLFQPPQDLQSFFYFDLNQKSFCLKTLEMVKNSLDNFAQNNISDGRVSLWLDATTSGLLTVTAVDNGTGVPADVLPFLFQEPISSTKDFRLGHLGGRGLGLYDMKSWAQENGGDITYTNLEPGSKFILSVSTHHNAYPVDEIGAPSSIEDARNRMKEIYQGKLVAAVRAQEAISDLSAEKQTLIAYAADWTDPVDQLPYALLIAQARTLIKGLSD